jgi:hypothetical protein
MSRLYTTVEVVKQVDKTLTDVKTIVSRRRRGVSGARAA